MARSLQRERERERERDEQRIDIIRARAKFSQYFSKLLYRRYIVSYDIAVFYFYGKKDFSGDKWDKRDRKGQKRRMNVIQNNLSSHDIG
jgi:serine phosphatase RsbU (regulator of sigma subunit)